MITLWQASQVQHLQIVQRSSYDLCKLAFPSPRRPSPSFLPPCSLCSQFVTASVSIYPLTRLLPKSFGQHPSLPATLVWLWSNQLQICAPQPQLRCPRVTCVPRRMPVPAGAAATCPTAAGPVRGPTGRGTRRSASVTRSPGRGRSRATTYWPPGIVRQYVTWEWGVTRPCDVVYVVTEDAPLSWLCYSEIRIIQKNVSFVCGEYAGEIVTPC